MKNGNAKKQQCPVCKGSGEIPLPYKDRAGITPDQLGLIVSTLKESRYSLREIGLLTGIKHAGQVKYILDNLGNYKAKSRKGKKTNG